jgi:serine/threonine protein kinase/tetratricopeptide (TPR) repeat protein
MVGKTISHYKILEKLGEGGMGVVYKAEDLKLKRIVALKFLPPELTRDPEAKERFIQEAQAASALDHPNICTIHEIDETVDGQLFIVMACYDGETLKKKIASSQSREAGSRSAGLSVDSVIDIAIQIAQGLVKAHKHGIVHRDIKPANVMITNDGMAKILDFGLAKLAGQIGLTKFGTTLGTAAYMSPEQTQGESVDQRSDIWSFGVVLYEMLTGQLPFKGEYEQAVIYSILNEEPEPPTGLRSDTLMELERIILKALVKKPAERYQHLEELLIDLKNAGTTTAPFVPKRKFRRIAYIVLGTVILMLFCGILWMFLQKKSDIVQKRKSIAVLPFRNLSAEGPHAYFAGGLHDELLTQLSKVAALKVISRTSVMGYVGTTKRIKQIANELGVQSVVEGSVQVEGERLRVNVQLIDAATDAHLWAERYDRTLDDAFAIQSDVAQQIVAAVGAALSNTEQQGLTVAPTANAEAYRLYLQGREYHTRPGYLQQDTEIAQELYERALALDPGFALAHAALSQVHGWMYWSRYDPSPTRAMRQREEAEIALRLAPDLPEAHVAIGLSYYFGRRDYRQALKEYVVALERMPNDAELWASIGYVHRRLGNWSDVIAAFEKAVQLNPRDANLFWDLGGGTYRVMHRYAEAVQAYDRALILAPDLLLGAVTKGRIYLFWQGQFDTLRAALSRLPRDADVAVPGTRAFQYVQLLYWERQADSMLQVLMMTPITVFEQQGLFLPRSLYAARAHQLRGDRSAAHAAFNSALMLLDSAIQKLPDDYRVHSARGLALAGLGRRDEAIHEANWLQQSAIYREDAYFGPSLAEERAQILAQIGQANSALDELERLLAGPSWISVYALRLNPCWDPIRNHPRFQELLTKYAMR